MVGFGSSLRMGRRSGWEGAYLDYETLKLLLSQIESVYEEEGHHSHADNFMGEWGTNGRSRKRTVRSDYRDDLFLESDSVKAFASSQSDQDDDSSESSVADLEQQRTENRQLVTAPQSSSKRFSLTYSHEGASSSSEDSYGADGANNCGGVIPWQSEKNAVVKKSQSRRSKEKKRFPSSQLGSNKDSSGLDTFIMEEVDDQYSPGNTNSYTSSLFNLGVSSENTGLLSQTAQNMQPSFYSFYTGSEDLPQQIITPPRSQMYPASGSYTNSNMMGNNVNTFITAQTTSPISAAPILNNKLNNERRRARRQRRRRRLASKRKEREKRVPQHLRIAHSKARAITERFLGLLRAEVEKVTLFAQARLGELADTAGSLRFLSFEDGNSVRGNARPTSYEHPLSDGGIHPSASSSSDEGASGQALFPWSDSSSDDEENKESNRPSIQNQFSSGGVSAQIEQRENLSSRAFPLGVSSSKASYDRKQEAYEATRRQIQHFEELRRERPIFTRNDHLVGEDLLFVSAVDEADAYCAVGVELMHILKYICVNLIAVRKICRKHDRLLMNRMLGGYYHRKRTTRKGAQENNTLGGIDIYEAHPALIGQVNRYKLVGVYDNKIQQLANSRTVKVVFSCLAMALSENEVSRSRADFLARLNSASNPKRRTRTAKKAEPPSYFASLGSFDLPGGWGKVAKEKRTAEVEQAAPESDDEDHNGPPSTASSISLTRLRFTVLSVSALLEAARSKLDPFATYLSRSMLSFTGQAVVGEGLDGCSRKTLDFLVSYNPDAALLLDSDSLYRGLKRGRRKQQSIGTVMRSSLAVGLFTQPGVSSESLEKSVFDGEQTIMNALSILPTSEGIDLWAVIEDRAPSLSSALSISRFTDFPPALFRVNRFSYFLYTVGLPLPFRGMRVCSCLIFVLRAFFFVGKLLYRPCHCEHVCAICRSARLLFGSSYWGCKLHSDSICSAPMLCIIILYR
jgi:hypothetical protein